MTFSSSDTLFPPPWSPGAVGEAGKRLVDLLVGTVLALLAVPVLAVLVPSVMVSLRTWRPLFVQDRVGRGGRLFKIVKLRTLPASVATDADKYSLTVLRLTGLGRFLRATHLDELPQLFLVPLGRMSLVGPRPEMPRLAAGFDPSFAAERARIRPGCTGLWQVSEDAGRLIAEVPQYDRFYLRYRSARLDAWILLRTVLVVVSGTRRARLADVPVWVAASRVQQARVDQGVVIDA